MKDGVIKKAKEIFDFKNEIIVGYSPGRVNLIGEHLDYNGGYVLPCTLDIGTYGAVCGREDNRVYCFSDNFPEKGPVMFTLNKLIYQAEDEWANYVKGMVKELNPPFGFDLYVKGNIPPGAGLSSSASLEILIGLIINQLYQLNYSRIDLVKMAQKVENVFIGVKSGIMDQFVIGMIEKKAAMLLNTANLDYKCINVDFQNYTLVIGNTNKRRTLQSSKYNERREECNDGFSILRKKYHIDYLCQLKTKNFNESIDLFSDDIIRNRVRHVITENERTLEAFQALKAKNIQLFGKLLNESHCSLRDDYEVTGLELDTMVSLFQKFGAIGARMTGAGFGGCMIALVPNELISEITVKVESEYTKSLGLTPEFYIVNIGNGAKIL